MRSVLLTLILLLVANTVVAQRSRSFGVAYYNVDNLYDTKPSQFYDDKDYTPRGHRGWDEHRYKRKIGQVAQVVDSIALPVVVLYGVENEAVVRDIAEACQEDYAYIHRLADSRDGLDFALLYFADRFQAEQVTAWRGALCVEGLVGGQRFAIIANHRCSSLGVLLEERNLLEGNNNIIILGEPNKLNFHEFSLRDATLRAERAGRGDYLRAGRWQMRSRVATNVEAECYCDVYVKRSLLDKRGAPWPTFDGMKYFGGYSKFLPIFIYFEEILAY